MFVLIFNNFSGMYIRSNPAKLDGDTVQKGTKQQGNRYGINCNLEGLGYTIQHLSSIIQLLKNR